MEANQRNSSTWLWFF